VSWKRIVPWVVLAVAVLGVLIVATRPQGGDPVDARVKRITNELRCEECQGLSVADSNASTSAAIRDDVRARVEAGESDEAIRQVYIDTYGEGILMNPTSDGVSVLVWVVPILAFVLGAALVMFTLVRWRGGKRRHATVADEALVRDLRSES
jgi:cytochrome c-type biogenesis protein CcmH/NrfF